MRVTPVAAKASQADTTSHSRGTHQWAGTPRAAAFAAYVAKKARRAGAAEVESSLMPQPP